MKTSERPRPRVVLVHGFTQTGASWHRVRELLEGDHEVLAPDLAGHGTAPEPAGEPEGGAALLAAGRAIAHSCGQGTYVGYSLGGRCCLHLALGERASSGKKARVERLVIVGTHPGIEDRSERERRRAADAALADRIEAGRDEGLASFVDEWLAGPLFSRLDPVAADRPSRMANSAKGLAASLRSMGTGAQEPLWDRLGELAIPVLVVAGAEDEKFCELGKRTVAAVGENASLHIVEASGHAVPFERPEEFAALVREFAAKC